MAKTAGNAAAEAEPKPKRRPGGKTLAIKPGRESVYDPTRHPERIRRFALLGLTEAEMAFQLGISEQRVNEWKKQHPAFREAIASGRTEADAYIAERLYSRAAGMTVPAAKVVALKDRVETVEYEEYLPPDVNAARLWLFNRDPKRWRDKREIEVSGSIEHQISAMTPEDRMKRLLELQAKAALVIEGEAVEVKPEDGDC